MKVLGVLIVAVLLAVWPVKVSAAGFCKNPPYEYMFEPIKAKIVNADTGQPIEGAIVIAFWKTIQPIQFLKIEESVTDSNGEFSFPGWGPIKRPDGCLWDSDPHMKVFKPGNFGWGGGNSVLFERFPGSEKNFNPVTSRVRKSRYDGQTIKLRPFVIGAVEEYPSAANIGKIIRYTLTEKHWCEQIHFVLRGFDNIDDIPSDVDIIRPSKIAFSVPNLLNILREQRKLFPDCFVGESLKYLEKK